MRVFMYLIIGLVLALAFLILEYGKEDKE